MTFAGIAHAQGNMAVGGHLMLGGAGIAENYGDSGGFMGGSEYEFRARLAAGLGGFFHYSLTDMIVLTGGLDIIGKGGKASEDGITLKIYTRHMDFPLGVFATIQGIQIGGALVPSITLAGKMKSEEDGITTEQDFTDEMWDNIQRFNLGLRIFGGYAIPVGPVAIVPGLMYQMDLLNATKGDWKDADARMRSINLMLTVGVEYDL